MRRLGFSSILADEDQSPIIATFDRPSDLDFETFYARLNDKGFVIYPGKVTRRDTFRIGCIGAIDETVIAKALAAIEETLREMRVDPRTSLRLAGE
jgi:2-aminoethylphosphonate-pyruvate transaminase